MSNLQGKQLGIASVKQKKMKFEVFSIIPTMVELYSMPLTRERFQAYITKLQGNTKGDLSMPISGFNPMAKPHVHQKLMELKDLEAEKVMAEALVELNSTLETSNDKIIQVVLNLADDLKGGWTNHYTTDFDSKFKLNAFVSRNFCTPYFWTSENYTKELIRQRTLEYAARTLYWIQNSKPVTLADHLRQEVFVVEKTCSKQEISEVDVHFIHEFYEENKDEDDYSVLFNFFYGDEASKSLEYPQYGIGEIRGFDFARMLN